METDKGGLTNSKDIQDFELRGGLAGQLSWVAGWGRMIRREKTTEIERSL